MGTTPPPTTPEIGAPVGPATAIGAEGGATFDERVGLSHTTGQITHHIAPDVDTERDHLEELEALLGKKLVMRARGSFHQEQFELFGTDEKSLNKV